MKQVNLLRRVCVAMVMMVCAVYVAQAHDFEVDGIYYNITSETNKTVGVTYKGESYSTIIEYSGDIVVPENVSYNDTLYSVVSIGNHAFYNCGDMTSIAIPNSVTSIGEYAFYKCSGLTNATIGNSVEFIGTHAFGGCRGLISITIPDSVTGIGRCAFYGCSSLTSVTIGNSVESIGAHAFCYCSGLKSLIIPNSVKSIGNSAFSDCSSLTSVTIPNSVASIGEYAFLGCSGLTSITSKRRTPPVCGIYAFKDVDVNIPLIVPLESVSLYMTASEWKYFKNILGQDMSGVEDTFTDNGEVLIEVARYDANGKSIAAPVKGVNIVRYSNGTVKKVFEK